MIKRTTENLKFSDSALHATDLALKRLRWRKDPSYHHIHEALIRCRDVDGYNCGSFGCRLCRERAQGTFASALSKGWRKKRQLFSWTLVPSDGWVAYNEIDTFDLKACVRRHRVKLKRIIPAAIRVAGGVDFSLNIYENGQRWWQVHLHFLAGMELNADSEALLRKRYPARRDLAIFKPLLLKTISSKDVEANSAYSLKSYHTKRSIFIAEPESGRCGYRSSEGLRLPADADEMLQLALSKYRVSDALFLVGLKRVRSSDPAKIKLRRA